MANVREPATESQFHSINIRGVDSDGVEAARSTGVGLLLAGVEVTATAAEINKAADVSAMRQELTATAAVTPGVQSVELNHATVVVAATLADLAAHPGFLMVKNTSASGTAAHTVTAAAGTWNGTATVITLNAPNEAILVYIDSAGDGTIIENVGAVALS